MPKVRLVFSTLMVLLCAGCATPQVISSNPRTVVLEGASSYNTAETQAAADAECSKHGRYAIHRPDNQRDGLVTYECVE